jgi:hypothetical protein
MIVTPECLLTAESVKRIRGRAMTRAMKLARQVGCPVYIFPTAKRSAMIDTARPSQELVRELGEVWQVTEEGALCKM